MTNEIKKIVLTGPPCSGKSTALSRVVEFVNSLGVRAVSVPEAATELKLNELIQAVSQIQLCFNIF